MSDLRQCSRHTLSYYMYHLLDTITKNIDFCWRYPALLTPDLSVEETACRAGSPVPGVPRRDTVHPRYQPCQGTPAFLKRTGAQPHTLSAQPGTCGRYEII